MPQSSPGGTVNSGRTRTRRSPERRSSNPQRVDSSGRRCPSTRDGLDPRRLVLVGERAERPLQRPSIRATRRHRGGGAPVPTWRSRLARPPAAWPPELAEQRTPRSDRRQQALQGRSRGVRVPPRPLVVEITTFPRSEATSGQYRPAMIAVGRGAHRRTLGSAASRALLRISSAGRQQSTLSDHSVTNYLTPKYTVP